MRYTYFQKFLSGFLIFSLLFSYTFRIPFFGLFSSVFADDVKYYDLVSILVQESIYDDVKAKVKRYATDVQNTLENTKVVILPVPDDASPFNIASLNESLYYEGYKSLQKVSFDSQLVGTVIVGKLPFPVVYTDNNFAKSIVPYVDFDQKSYIYNKSSGIYEENQDNLLQIRADIWHGVISPNTGSNGDDIEAINDYFDKNHDYYTGNNNFSSSKGLINGKEGDPVPSSYEPFVFYYDQLRENEAFDLTRYAGYEAYLKNLEDISYNRFTKELAEKVKDIVLEKQDESLSDLLAKVDPSMDLSSLTSGPDAFNSSDIASRYITQNTTRNFLDTFNEGTIGDIRKFVHNAGRYNEGGDSVNVDMLPFLVTVLDSISSEIIKDANTELESYIDTLVSSSLSRNIPLPTEIYNSNTIGEMLYTYEETIIPGDGSGSEDTIIRTEVPVGGDDCSYIRTNFLHGVDSSRITNAMDCTIYRGTTQASGSLVESNRGYNVDHIEADIKACISGNTEGYWGGNSPLNLDFDSISSAGKYVLKSKNLKLAISPLYDKEGAVETNVSSDNPSPLKCLDNNYLVSERYKMNASDECDLDYRIPNKGAEKNWTCATNNIQVVNNKSFEDMYDSFGTLSIAPCLTYRLKLDNVIIKSRSNINPADPKFCKSTAFLDFNYKKINSYYYHKSPTSEELSGQIDNLTTPSLPVDKDRYVDFIAADGTHQKIKYPYLYRVESSNMLDISAYGGLLKNTLDTTSTQINNIISATNPSKLSGNQAAIYNLLKVGPFNSTNIDLYAYLKTKDSQYTNTGDSKNNSYYDSLSFSIFWNNLKTPSAKYKFIFEHYLSDEFGGNNLNFHLPKNKKMYEVSYLGAPGDEKNMYIKLDPNDKTANPYAEILSQNSILDSYLFGYNLSSEDGQSSEEAGDLFKCSPPDGVPIREWIPAVVCRLNDMLPPQVGISDGQCGSSLIFPDEDSESTSQLGDSNTNGICDCIESELDAGGKLELQSSSNRYYYNSSGYIEAQLKDKNNQILAFDNATKIQFMLTKIEAPKDSSLPFNEVNTELIYDSATQHELSQDLKDKYVNFDDIGVVSKGGKANLLFSVKAKEANLYFKAYVKESGTPEGSESIYVESGIQKIEVRGDRLFVNSYAIDTTTSEPLLSLGNAIAEASEYTNIYFTDANKFDLNANYKSIANNSLARKKIVFSLSNYSLEGTSLEVFYPLTIKLKKGEEDIIESISLPENEVTNFKPFMALKEAGEYTLFVQDRLGNNFTKSFTIISGEVKSAKISLGTNILSSGGSVSTNILTLYDMYNNVSVGDIYDIEGTIQGGSLVFQENNTQEISFQTVEGVRVFRLQSSDVGGESTLNFTIRDSSGVRVLDISEKVSIYENIKLDIVPIQTAVRVGGDEYKYKVIVRDKDGNKLSSLHSRAYAALDSKYGVMQKPYFDIVAGEGLVVFNSSKLAQKEVKIEFQVEGIAEIYKRYVDILPEKPVKIDIALTQDKIEADPSASTVAKIQLKDRYGNLVFTDNSSQITLEILPEYQDIISSDAKQKTLTSGSANFTIFGKATPGTAHFKVSVSPSLLGNAFTIPGQAPFYKDELVITGMRSAGNLTTLGQQFFEEYSSDMYRSKFSTLFALQESSAYIGLPNILKDQLLLFWEQKNKIVIVPASSNTAKIETFYFWKADSIIGKKYNSLYTTLLGAPYGDIFSENYLAGSLLFDKDNRSLAVTTLLNNPLQYNDVFSIETSGKLKRVSDGSDLSQNIIPSVSVDKDGILELSLSNDALGTYVGNIAFTFDKTKLVFRDCDIGDNENLSCEPDKQKSSIYLGLLDTSYKIGEKSSGMGIQNSLGETVFSISEDGKITKNVNFSLTFVDSLDGMLQFLLKSGDKKVAIMGIYYVGATFSSATDFNLYNTAKSSLKNNIATYIGSNLYSFRKVDSGANDTMYFIYYNDPFSSGLEVNKVSGNDSGAYENYSTTAGLGWEAGNKILLSFAAGEGVGRAVQQYQSFSLINLGDPVVALKTIQKNLPGTATPRAFDSTIGIQALKDESLENYKIFDYNNDQRDDVVYLKQDGNVGLLEGVRTSSRFRKLGNLLHIQDIGTKNIFDVGDFTGDGYDDIFFIDSKGTPFLMNNSEKDFLRVDLSSMLSLSGTILQVRVFDMDSDGKDDIVTLDDGGSIHIFYGNGTSHSPKFTKLFIDSGFSLQLSDAVRSDGSLIYFDGLYQLPEEGDNTDLLASNEAYLAELQANLAGGVEATSMAYNEGILDNIIFTQVPIVSGESQGISDMAGNLNESVISPSYDEALDSLDDFILSASGYVETPLYYNPTSYETYIKSEYSESVGFKVSKNFVDVNGGALQSGDEVKVFVTVKNTSGKTLNNIKYIENVLSPLLLKKDDDLWFSSTPELTPFEAPSNYDFMLKLPILNSGGEITFNYKTVVAPLTFGFMQVGLFEKGEVGDDIYGDIMIKASEKNCGQNATLYRSTFARTYLKGETALICPIGDGNNDEDNNGIPDNVDDILDGSQEELLDFANDSLNDFNLDGDSDGIPDSEDTFDDYNSDNGFSSLGGLSSAVDELSDEMDTFIEGLSCGFGGGSCISSPLNWAPLAPGSDPTLFGMPIGDGLRVDEGFPTFSALNWVQLGSYCVPMPWPPAVNLPGCVGKGAGGMLGVTSPTNYIRLFVTPTITGAVGIAICYGAPAITAGYTNPPGLHPVVPGGNCVVAATPLLGCEDDGSDGDISSQGFSQTQNSTYDVISGNCTEQDYQETGTGSSSSISFTTAEVQSYVQYKTTGDKTPTVTSVLESMFSKVAKGTNSSSGSIPQDGFITMDNGGTNDMSLSVDIDTKALMSGNIGDVIQIDMQRIWPFPDFVMEWVTRQIEEIVTKLTDFPTLFIILPDFSGIMDDRWGNFPQNVKDAFNTGKSSATKTDTQLTDQISSLESQIASLDCNGKDAFACGQKNMQISKLKGRRTFSSQTITGINEVYKFLSNMPVIAIQPEIVSVNIPWADKSLLDKAILDFKLKKDDWLAEIDRASQAWSLGGTCAPDDTECKEENDIKNKLLVNSQKLVGSLEKNIDVLEKYKKFPEDLGGLIQKKEERLEQVLCNLESISQFTGGRIGKNGKRFKTWVELYILIKAMLKSWQLLVDVFVDYDASCHQCKNERNDLLYYVFKLINMIIPKIPVIEFPKWPDIILDLHDIRVGILVHIPEFKFNLRPIVIPQLPDLTLPGVPTAGFSLPELPILPLFELPELPDLPSLPTVDLPDLPPPPKLPKILSVLEGVLDILKLITKVMCILKTSPFVPEWRAGDQIAFITERTGYLPTDFIDISTPQFSYPFVDAIKVSGHVNFEVDNEFVVEMVRQVMKPLNSMSNDIVNMFDYKTQDINLGEATPSDINLNSEMDDLLNEYNEGGQKFVNNIAFMVVKGIHTINQYMDNNMKDTLTTGEFKLKVSEELQTKTIANDPKLEAYRQVWKDVLGYSFEEEDSLIQSLQKSNIEKFNLIRDIAREEIEKTKDLKTIVRSMNYSPIKNLSEVSISSEINHYNDLLSAYNLKGISAYNQMISGENNSKQEANLIGENVMQRIQGGLASFNKRKEESQNQLSLGKSSLLADNLSVDGGSCTTSSSAGQDYVYKGLYVVEAGKSYRLFDYLDELDGKEEVIESDFDEDTDVDLFYETNGEVFLKKNLLVKSSNEHVSSVPEVVGVGNNKFLNGDIFSSAVDNARETLVTSNSVNLSFSAHDDVAHYRVALYDRVDKYNRLLDSAYSPRGLKQYVIDAVVSESEKFIQNKNEYYTLFDNIARIGNVGNLGGITLHTFKFKDIAEDLNDGSIVNINILTPVYTGRNGAKLGFVHIGENIDEDTIKYVYVDKYSNILFNDTVSIVSISGNAYIKGNEMTEYDSTSIIPYIGMPLLPGSKIFISDKGKVFDDSNHLDIVYSHGADLALDFMTMSGYEIYDLGSLSDSYYMQTDLENDYYYARMKTADNNLFGTQSNQVLLSAEKEADIYPPEVTFSNTIKIPVYQKRTIDFTDFIYDHSGIGGIQEFYVDFNPSIDSDGDGNFKNDKDTHKITINKSLTSLSITFGPYDALVKKEIVLNVMDENGNKIEKLLDFEVYAPVPQIRAYSPEAIFGVLDEILVNEPVNLYRYRGGFITPLKDAVSGIKGNTNVDGSYVFTLPNATGSGVSIKQGGNEIAVIDELTGCIKNVAPGFSIEVIPSDISEPYPKISLFESGKEIYSQSIHFNENISIQEVSNFDSLAEKGIYLLINDGNYSSFSIPMQSPLNPGVVYIYDNRIGNTTPLFTFYPDGRIETANVNYSLGYGIYGGSKIMLKLFYQDNEIGRLLYNVEGNYIIQ